MLKVAPRRTQLVLLGKGGVGKSSLISQLCYHYFSSEYTPTIERMHETQIVLKDGTVIEVDLLDTAGQEGFTTLMDQYLHSGDGFILVYSVSNRESFEELDDLYRKIQRSKGSTPYAAILVGNKIDDEDLRSVTNEEGIALGKKLHLPFFETSARTNINIKEAFTQIMYDIERYKHPEEEEEPVATTEQTKPRKSRRASLKMKQLKKENCLIS
eukprot:TRINITY_DN317_c0_g1_i1.p1 TRINITY_DN317_c0_g1~~TRINITY_DN317_c0_g1_i1.p1  ORF type:complete len:213 (+),score=33.77 TRINITY_DN317_c0_g1_i1:328-966(+)